MYKNINIPSNRKFSLHYVDKVDLVNENNVSGDVLHTQVYGLYNKDLVNVSNLDVGKKVYVTSYDNKILVKRVA
tara:strand:+ start:299 stop:520 length:222 start_codon:yes stop_codon:yes gene_type:complete